MDFERDDPVLLTFYLADDESYHAHFDDLCLARIYPIVKMICSSSMNKQVLQRAGLESEDVQQEVAYRLGRVVYTRKETGAGKPIEDFDAYCSTVTRNYLKNLSLSTKPFRRRLRDEVLCIFDTLVKFARWKTDDKNQVGGFSTWKGQQRYVSRLNTNSIVRDIEDILEKKKHPIQDAARLEVREILENIFTITEHPVTVKEIHRQIGLIKEADKFEPTELVFDEANTNLSQDFDEGLTFDALLQDSNFLRPLWEEIKNLSRAQATALLLHMRDHTGRRSGMYLFEYTNVAKISEIADLLRMGFEEIERIADGDALDNPEIALLLALTPLQVSNLRISARRKLIRRIRANHKNIFEQFGKKLEKLHS